MAVDDEPKLPLSKAETKVVLKAALKEWLDEQAALFGRWTARFIGSAALFALAYFILQMNGWKRIG